MLGRMGVEMDWKKEMVSRSISSSGKTLACCACVALICDSEKTGQCSTVYASFQTKERGLTQDISLAHINFRNVRRTYKAGEGWTSPDEQEFFVLDGYTKDIVADGIEDWSHAREVAFDYVSALLTNAEWMFNGKNVNMNAVK